MMAGGEVLKAMTAVVVVDLPRQLACEG